MPKPGEIVFILNSFTRPDSPKTASPISQPKPNVPFTARCAQSIRLLGSKKLVQMRGGPLTSLYQDGFVVLHAQ